MELCNLKQKLLIACHISTWSLSTRIFLDNCNRLRRKKSSRIWLLEKRSFLLRKGCQFGTIKIIFGQTHIVQIFGRCQTHDTKQSNSLYTQPVNSVNLAHKHDIRNIKKTEIRCGVKLEWQKRHIENMKAVDIKKSPLCYYALEWFNALMMTMMMNIRRRNIMVRTKRRVMLLCFPLRSFFLIRIGSKC